VTLGCSFWDADGFIHVDFLEPGTYHQLRALHCNTQIFETMIKKGSEAQEEHFAAT
jgi:hypothetical protein